MVRTLEELANLLEPWAATIPARLHRLFDGGNRLLGLLITRPDCQREHLSGSITAALGDTPPAGPEAPTIPSRQEVIAILDQELAHSRRCRLPCAVILVSLPEEQRLKALPPPDLGDLCLALPDRGRFLLLFHATGLNKAKEHAGVLIEACQGTAAVIVAHPADPVEGSRLLDLAEGELRRAREEAQRIMWMRLDPTDSCGVTTAERALLFGDEES